MSARIDTITQIEINISGKLHIKPKYEKFTLIYRTGTEVHWDEKSQTLFSPKPREWNYLDWFKHIIDVAKTEYSVKLEIDEKTDWINIPNELRTEITKAQQHL